jgi:hypothetical protein
MADVLFVAVLVAFFAVAVGLVRACDRIIGPEETVATDREQTASELSEAA